MNSHSSLPKAAVASLSEVVDMDRDESSTKIEARTNETSKDEKAAAIETEDDGLEDDQNQNPSDGAKVKGKRNHEMMSDQENAIAISDSSDDSTEKNSLKIAKRRRLKLEDIRIFDILLPNHKNSSGVRKAKIDFYSGFISYRKLIDRTRPIFMESDTHDHRLKIGRWLIDKIRERGGRFLKEDGDGSTGNCKVMTADDALDYTVKTFDDPASAFASFFGENNEDQSLAKSLQESNVDSKPESSAHEQDTKAATALSSQQSRASLADTLRTEILSSKQDPFTIAREAITKSYENIYASSEPDAAAAMPLHPPSSSNLYANSDRIALENGLENTVIRKSELVLQSCLREMQVIRTELAENQEILLIRQERLRRLETEFIMFQDTQMFLPSERWWADRILRQEEIFENRELLGIHHQRCRRLSTLLQLKERQVCEHQTIMGREKMKLETLRSMKRQGSAFENEVREKLMEKIISGQDVEAKAVNGRELIDNGSNNKTNMLAVEEQIMKKKLCDAQRVMDARWALECEMKRRATVEQNSAMEQEIQYRQAMGHAAKRQASMKQAMEVRQLMMSRAGTSQHLSEMMFREACNSNNDIQNVSSAVTESRGGTDDARKEIETGSRPEISATEGKEDEGNVKEADDSKDIQKIHPDVTESMGDTYHSRKEIGTRCHQETSMTETENDDCQSEEDDDDDYIVI